MDKQKTIIRAHGRGFPGFNFKEIWDFREMLVLMVWRDVKVRYIQSALGIGWAVFPAISQTIIYTVIFGRLVRIDSDGAPYSLFALCGVIPWVYFSQSLNSISSSVYGAGSFLHKVYFPRMILPLSAMLEKGFDFAVSLVVLFVVVIFFGGTPNWNIIFLPLLILIMMIAMLGIGMFVAAIVVHFRDLLHMMGYITLALMYTSPVVYPASLVPEKYLYLYALNPTVGVIEGFRAALISTRPMPWDLIGISAAVSIFSLVAGAVYFRWTEPKFADVV